MKNKSSETFYIYFNRDLKYTCMNFYIYGIFKSKKVNPPVNCFLIHFFIIILILIKLVLNKANQKMTLLIKIKEIFLEVLLMTFANNIKKNIYISSLFDIDVLHSNL